ncbi:hypothetical protein [Streptomyces sp. NPDC088736]|uniref:hypothetical protein n=1 Tax=Streptomyces sp. NPDC088736 TaxID=3365881 RepID=UPI003823A8A7
MPPHPDDRPHDPHAAARTALHALGHTPSDDATEQLRQAARAAMADARTAGTPGGPDGLLADILTGAEALATIETIERAVTALIPLAETHLDGLEQQELATAFGLPGPPRDSPAGR